MRKTRTTETFKEEMKGINPNIEILGEYVNSTTKIRCRCKVDSYEWTPYPHNILKGSGCPECAKRKFSKSHNTFVNDVKKVNPNVEILGQYKNNYTKLEYRCKIDGLQWSMLPVHLLRGHGCPVCAKKQLTKPHKDFITQINRINPNIEILGKYKNNYTKLKCRCKIDDYEWESTPNHLLNGSGCPKCGGTLPKQHSDFVDEVREINPNIEILGEYINVTEKIRCKCKLDGYEWSTSPGTLLRHCGCPECSVRKRTYNLSNFKSRLAELDPEFLNQYIIHEETFTKAKNSIKVTHLKCNHTYVVSTAQLLLSGCGRCPNCQQGSLGENAIKDYLELQNIEFKRENELDIPGIPNTLRTDFVVRGNLFIEIHGEQHYKWTPSFQHTQEDFQNQQYRDLIKKNYYLENGKYIELPYLANTTYAELQKMFDYYYYDKAITTDITDIVPIPLIDLLTRHLKGKERIPFGDWCLFYGDMEYIDEESERTLNSRIKLIFSNGCTKIVTIREYLESRK